MNVDIVQNRIPVWSHFSSTLDLKCIYQWIKYFRPPSHLPWWIDVYRPFRTDSSILQGAKAGVTCCTRNYWNSHNSKLRFLSKTSVHPAPNFLIRWSQFPNTSRFISHTRSNLTGFKSCCYTEIHMCKTCELLLTFGHHVICCSYNCTAYTRLVTDALFYIILKPIKFNDFHKSRLFSDERETQMPLQQPLRPWEFSVEKATASTKIKFATAYAIRVLNWFDKNYGRRAWQLFEYVYVIHLGSRSMRRESGKNGWYVAWQVLLL
jgi:hypothetical protein